MNESQNIEWKELWRDEYLEWLCAFANAQGGKLYIGINDKGDVVGIKNAKNLLETIPNKIIQKLGIVADVNLLNKDEKQYIEIIVHPSNAAISCNGKFHYRVGSTKQELSGNALQDFLFNKNKQTWDEIICQGATLDDIDSEAIRYFVRCAVNSHRMSVVTTEIDAQSILTNLNLITVDGQLTNAAIVLFGKRPQRFVTCVEFAIGRFGASDSDLWFQDMVEGNIITMCDKVMDLLRAKYLISPIHYEGLQRIEELEIPYDALREAVFNAIGHKDYRGVHIQMKVFGDHIELWNSGVLPFPIEEIKTRHSSAPRNKLIANVFYRAGFIEHWGRGVDKICSDFRNAGLAEPIYESHCDGLRITIPRGKVTEKEEQKNMVVSDIVSDIMSDMSDIVSDKKQLVNIQMIIEYILEKRSIDAGTVVQILLCSPASARRLLKILTDNKVLIAQGENKGRKYVLAQNDFPTRHTK